MPPGMSALPHPGNLLHALNVVLPGYRALGMLTCFVPVYHHGQSMLVLEPGLKHLSLEMRVGATHLVHFVVLTSLTAHCTGDAGPD